jgi:AraC-like DNA-binding protein
MNKLHAPASDPLVPASDPAAPGTASAGGPAAASEHDPLSDVLRTVRLTGAMFFLWDVSWPFVMPVPNGRAFAPIILPGAQQIISYHIITEGSCWGGMRGEAPLDLRTGDILLIPHGDAYAMSSSARTCVPADVPLAPALDFYRRMAAGELPFVVVDGGGGPTTTRVVCGFLGCDVRPFNPMLAALPPIVRVRPAAEPTENRLRALVEYAVAEARAPKPGSQSVLVRLSELLFVEVVRRCLAALPAAETGWLAGLRDPVVGRALMLLHRNPAYAWTLETLAAEVGISRSRLAESFTRLVGQPPIQYLAQWRIQLATRMLADGTAKVASVARDVGYESEAAFSRAFKRLVGSPPARWRDETAARPGS